MITDADHAHAAAFLRDRAPWLARQFLPVGFWSWVVQVVLLILRVWLDREDDEPDLTLARATLPAALAIDVNTRRAIDREFAR